MENTISALENGNWLYIFCFVLFQDGASKVVRSPYDDSILGNSIYAPHYENWLNIFCMKTITNLYFKCKNNYLCAFKCVHASNI